MSPELAHQLLNIILEILNIINGLTLLLYIEMVVFLYYYCMFIQFVNPCFELYKPVSTIFTSF